MFVIRVVHDLIFYAGALFSILFVQNSLKSRDLCAACRVAECAACGHVPAHASGHAALSPQALALTLLVIRHFSYRFF
jgi:hypothetical protein